jgi:hypothetical protein
MHMGLLQILMRKWTFHLATSVLISVWTNRHNSRQDYKFGRAHQPVESNLQVGLQHEGSWSHEKGCGHCDEFLSCQQWSCSGKRSYESTNRRRWLYNVGIDIAEPKIVCDTKGVTWWVKRALRITTWFQKFDVASRYTHLEETNETSDSDKDMKDTFEMI